MLWDQFLIARCVTGSDPITGIYRMLSVMYRAVVGLSEMQSIG
jgi:hypothetical protein